MSVDIPQRSVAPVPLYACQPLQIHHIALAGTGTGTGTLDKALGTCVSLWGHNVTADERKDSVYCRLMVGDSAWFSGSSKALTLLWAGNQICTATAQKEVSARELTHSNIHSDFSYSSWSLPKAVSRRCIYTFMHACTQATVIQVCWPCGSQAPGSEVRLMTSTEHPQGEGSKFTRHADCPQFHPSGY